MDAKIEEDIAAEQSPDSSVKQSEKSRLRDSAETIGLTLLAALFLKLFIMEAYTIPTASMENTLLAGDFILVNKFIFGAKTPQYIPFTAVSIPRFSLPGLMQPKTGDVVVFEFPGSPGVHDGQVVENYVKRCVAGPGDTLVIKDKTVFVNGRQLLLPPQARFENTTIIPNGVRDYRIFPPGSAFNEDNYGPLVVPKKGEEIHLVPASLEQYRELIEREGHSIGINEAGAILIDGAAAIAYQVQKDYYFMMGDNRDNSLDSRFWGFVPDDLILGKAMLVYWSWDISGSAGGLDHKLTSIRWNRMGMIVR